MFSYFFDFGAQRCPKRPQGRPREPKVLKNALFGTQKDAQHNQKGNPKCEERGERREERESERERERERESRE